MSILEEILEEKTEEVKLLRKNQQQLQLNAGKFSPRGFVSQLISHKNPRIIAEIKKASPSKGLICKNFEPLKIARDYQAKGAAAISVLTDKKFFQGELVYLEKIRNCIHLPLLRKDFIVDEIQIYQSRAAGADAILLIAAALSEKKLFELLQLALEQELDVLVEVHDRDETEQSLRVLEKLKSEKLSDRVLLGINNRNLSTFETSLSITEEILQEFSSQILSSQLSIVSESGISNLTEIERLEKAGSSAFLIGEALMRENELLGRLTRIKT